MHRLFEPADFIKKQEFMDPAKDGRKKEPFSQIYYNQVLFLISFFNKELILFN